MRCPYCGGFNADQAQFCSRCGRDFVPQNPSGQPASRQSPPQRPPYQRPGPNPAATTPEYASTTRRRRQSVSTQAAITLTPAAPPAPEPPAPFPPRNMDQLQELEPGALAYTFVSDEVGVGRKKIVRIVYPRCAVWQQVATLLKAFKEYQTDQFDTIIIQGVVDQDNSVYTYTNGQLWFDRRVRLGSQLINRYQIETGTGLESDAVRIVLAEE
jgi:coenzyme F420-reducing hydrogenase delta subunit